jgi:hypothetical protein
MVVCRGDNESVSFPGGNTQETLEILLLGIRFAFIGTSGRGATANVAVFMHDSRI